MDPREQFRIRSAAFQVVAMEMVRDRCRSAITAGKDGLSRPVGFRKQQRSVVKPVPVDGGGGLSNAFEIGVGELARGTDLGAVLAKRDAWARIAGCMREEAGSVVGSVIV